MRAVSGFCTDFRGKERGARLGSTGCKGMDKAVEQLDYRYCVPTTGKQFLSSCWPFWFLWLSCRKDQRLPSSTSTPLQEKKKSHASSFSDILARGPGSGGEAKPKKEKKTGRFHLGSPLKHIRDSPKGSFRLGSDVAGEEVRGIIVLVSVLDPDAICFV